MFSLADYGPLPNPEALERARRNQENLVYWDWDDTLILQAYDKAQEERAAENTSVKTVEEETRPPVSDVKQWPEGSYCRALYSADGRYYEARVIAVNEGRRLVEYLGYKNQEEVDIKILVPSRGKKTRKNQIKMAKEELKYAAHVMNAEGQENNYPPPNYFHYPSVGNDLPPHHQPVPTHPNCEFPLNASEQSMPAMPLIPPIPPSSSLNNDQSTRAMLMSWFMTGYYTGLNENKNSSSACCCHGCHGHSH